MGLLRKMTGGVDKKLLESGILAQGVIADMRITGTTVQSGNGLVQRACIFTVEVNVDGKEPYTATCKQRIPEVQIPQFKAGSTMVAVRVNPDDPNDIVLDLQTAPPTVTTPSNPAHSAAEILATGEAGQAIIIDSQSINRRNAAGVDVYAFTLTVIPVGRDPYQIQVGNPTPPSALPFLFAGSRVPVRIGANPNAVVIDWEKAVENSKV